ncbi:hypothetical protein OEZ60_12445 [Defluviimonas sp. WL0024]|uniref:Uncharacterized protein n=2 Tax=Albidovulum TaxID=205889 RepID=A0ABT3J8L5_9RHOB|nr:MULTISPECIES: hypothetical protein [Defluviimonas]MCU9848812.1 hypothetical protein [Defluviimonas sp. WL0024]MCW3784023.1 hypothetical protein [Defluviimonas salinarum]
MPHYNEMFELSVEDMDLIETALRHSRDSLSQALLERSAADHGDRADTLRRIQELLGRLHNQKIFYRPRSGVYVGG